MSINELSANATAAIETIYFDVQKTVTNKKEAREDAIERMRAIHKLAGERLGDLLRQHNGGK